MTGVSEDGDITDEGGELTIETMGLDITVSVTMWWYPVYGGGGGGGFPVMRNKMNTFYFFLQKNKYCYLKHSGLSFLNPIFVLSFKFQMFLKKFMSDL